MGYWFFRYNETIAINVISPQSNNILLFYTVNSTRHIVHLLVLYPVLLRYTLEFPTHAKYSIIPCLGIYLVYYGTLWKQ